MRALEKALLIHLVYPQTSPVLPVLPDVSKSPRLHVLDTGMLNYFVGLQQEIPGTTDLNHNIAVRFYAGEILLSTITTPCGKTVQLLNLSYYLVSQIEKCLEWFEIQIRALSANADSSSDSIS